jgi:hypothetical protein
MATRRAFLTRKKKSQRKVWPASRETGTNPILTRNEGVLMPGTDKKHATSVLQLKRIDIVPHAESIAYLSRNCDLFRPEEFQALGKVEISHNGNFRYLSTLAIVDDASIVSDHQLGLDKHTFERLGLPEGSSSTIAPARTPASLDYVRAKIPARQRRTTGWALE